MVNVAGQLVILHVNELHQTWWPWGTSWMDTQRDRTVHHWHQQTVSFRLFSHFLMLVAFYCRISSRWHFEWKLQRKVKEILNGNQTGEESTEKRQDIDRYNDKNAIEWMCCDGVNYCWFCVCFWIVLWLSPAVSAQVPRAPTSSMRAPFFFKAPRHFQKRPEKTPFFILIMSFTINAFF